MLFEISELIRKEAGSTQEIEINEDLNDIKDKDVKFLKPVIGKAILTRTEDGVLVQFWVKTSVGLICDRCLREFEKPLELRFSQEYILETEKPNNVEQEEEKNEGFVVNMKNRIDFREALRQGILTSLPIKKLCRENCKGLCPKCGQNLNIKQCTCKNKRTKKQKNRSF